LALKFERIYIYYNLKLNRTVKGFSPGGFRQLLNHNWPGNIRELESVVQKAVLFCEKDVIEASHIELQVPSATSGPAKPERSIPRGSPRAFTKAHILSLLKKHNNYVAHAIRDAGISRATFFRKMKKFGVRIERL